MRLGYFVGRSFCACARPRRSAPSNPAASFLHPKENTSTPHPAPGSRHFVPTRVRSSLRIINTVSFPSPSRPPAHPPPSNIQYRSKNPSSSSSSTSSSSHTDTKSHLIRPRHRSQILIPSVHYLSRIPSPFSRPPTASPSVLARKCGHLFARSSGEVTADAFAQCRRCAFLTRNKRMLLILCVFETFRLPEKLTLSRAPANPPGP